MVKASEGRSAQQPQPKKSTQVFVVCVIRKADECLLASFSVNKDYSADDVVDLVAEKMPRMKEGNKYSDVIDEGLTVHFQLDGKGRIYAIMTTARYSPRVAFTLLAELSVSFSSEYGPRVKSATANSLSKESKPLLKSFIDKYGDPGASGDALSKVQGKLDQATNTMKENIEIAVKNTKLIEDIEDQSEALEQKSREFQSNAKKLKDKMWWKKMKTYLLIGGLVTSVLLIIIVPVAVQASAASAATSAAAGPAPAPAPAPAPIPAPAPTPKPVQTGKPHSYSSIVFPSLLVRSNF